MQRYYVTGISLLGLIVGASTVLWTTSSDQADGHCQVPCGIYDDQARIAQLREDATTIAKAVHEVNKLAGQGGAQSLNQAVRWIDTKEHHASHIIEVVAEYFLTQKVKPVAPGADGYPAYLKKVADHHAVMVAAMKAKQNTDGSHVDSLRQAIEALAGHYKK